MNTSLLFSDLERKSRCWRESGDCSVKAVAISLGICYADAWYTCRKAGREYRSGMIMPQIEQAFRSKGKELVPITFYGDIVKFMEHYPKGAFMFEIPGHVVVYKDGVMHDNVMHWGGETLTIYHVLDIMEFEDDG